MYLVAIWACEVTEILTQKKLPHKFYYNDLTSPTSNQIPDIHIAVSVVYDTFKNYFRAFVFILFNPSF